jgi:hypothetical protein
MIITILYRLALVIGSMLFAVIGGAILVIILQDSRLPATPEITDFRTLLEYTVLSLILSIAGIDYAYSNLKEMLKKLEDL